VADVGIVGAGTAGLHLALLLQKGGLDPTLYAERSADDVRSGRLPNTVVHNHRTRSREREIGANLWDETAPPIDGHWHWVPVPGAPEPLNFPGYFEAPSLAVDYRLYQSHLLEEFEQRGGKVEIGAIDASNVARLAARHDLLVVSTGRGGLTELFPRIAERSLDGPGRVLSAGLYRGIADAGAPRHVVLSLLGPVGEIINIPMESRDGRVEVVLFECVPGGPLEPIARTPYADDPKAHDRLVLAMLRQFAPRVAERVDEAEFGVVDPTSILQGAVVPTVREGYVQLDEGTYAIAAGDAHAQMDPVVGLGANAASLSAFAVGEAILRGGPFDEAFCKRVDEARMTGILAHYDFTNFMLAPAPYIGEIICAMSQNPALANDFTDDFTRPWRHLEHLASAEATAAYVASFAEEQAPA
jgi:2-polyprenyl-6-methoxyphenol hydroxylase-like FAD-dependent oxidoreductase